MSFKDSYKELQQNIAPDEEFLRQLSEKMEIQKQKRKRLRIIMPSAAAFVGIAAVLVIFVNLSGQDPTNLPLLITGENNISYQQGIFTQEAIFKNDEDIPQQLAEKILDDETIVYVSDKNTFSDDDRITDEKRISLAEKIRNASETYSSQEKTEFYYMVVFEDGSVLKFTIGDNILAVEGKNFGL